MGDERMDVETVRRHVGKKVLIILNNNFQYTAIVPDFNGSSFSITDKFGESIDIECNFISFIKEVEE